MNAIVALKATFESSNTLCEKCIQAVREQRAVVQITFRDIQEPRNYHVGCAIDYLKRIQKFQSFHSRQEVEIDLSEIRGGAVHQILNTFLFNWRKPAITKLVDVRFLVSIRNTQCNQCGSEIERMKLRIKNRNAFQHVECFVQRCEVVDSNGLRESLEALGVTNGQIEAVEEIIKKSKAKFE